MSKAFDLRTQRLANQHLLDRPFKHPTEVVKWLGAVQAQDYPGAKWSLSLRGQGWDDEVVEAAFNQGHILRTHVMRPTWHFVMPEDIRWLLKLTAPRVKTILGHYDRKLELDQPLIKRSQTIFRQALKGQQYLTRQELKQALEAGGVQVEKGTHNKVQRLAHIVAHAELDAVLCSGPRRGKNFTYALLDERAPHVKELSHDAALHELTLRYFTSHGPATVHDLSWWSGLTVTEVKRGVELAGSALEVFQLEGKEYWSPVSSVKVQSPALTVFLMANYDEYTIAYKGYTAILNPDDKGRIDIRFPHALIINGRVAGMWRRVFTKKAVEITVRVFHHLNAAEKQGVEQAAQEYGRFLGTTADLTFAA